MEEEEGAAEEAEGEAEARAKSEPIRKGAVRWLASVGARAPLHHAITYLEYLARDR